MCTPRPSGADLAITVATLSGTAFTIAAKKIASDGPNPGSQRPPEIFREWLVLVGLALSVYLLERWRGRAAGRDLLWFLTACFTAAAALSLALGRCDRASTRWGVN